MHWKAVVSLALGGLLPVTAFSDGSAREAAQPQPVRAARPNIVMILADDLGYSDIGAMGGEIDTPNLDALAASGRILTNYHTGATCSPTRAMLMSGTDHHLAGLGSMAEVNATAISTNTAPWGKQNTYNYEHAPDGYEGYLNERVPSLPQLLKDGGYHTYMAGKWHLASTPADPAANAGRRTVLRPASFPNAKGFERSFALLQGAGSHFAQVPGKPIVADLASSYTEDDKPVSLPPDFYASKNYTDKLISYIDENRHDGKPFFAYLAFTAPHWPLQAPDADIARYGGRYDEGYEAIRARRIAKQKKLGLIPADFTPSPGLPQLQGHPRWADLTKQQRAMEARKMEVYAAMVENMDRHIGRLIGYLKQRGIYDDTLIVFASDNGAEGGPNFFPNNPNVNNALDNIGRPLSNVTYGERWAEVSATPFRLWKGFSVEGGVTAPLIVRMPRQIRSKPALGDLTHVTDLLPTFLELAGIDHSNSHRKGQFAYPITGRSLVSRLQDRVSSGPRSSDAILADELFTGRYVIQGDWKLVSMQPPFGDNRWQLFNLRRDRGETTDLSEVHPERAARLAAEYEAYAARVGVVHTPLQELRAPAP
ncbi:arylsulfatase [Cupriavidus basilensis]|uniref:Arylsulfatase n=1 Tax=Cupriavidus basilensis TaxID=68895 RepID=A0ABT6ARC5_9BURK|nr:arylsulfatase [Cupriavidus basilensis]MDF3835150.1 arylsulfatase [Cupriavidus basilensis]